MKNKFGYLIVSFTIIGLFFGSMYIVSNPYLVSNIINGNWNNSSFKSIPELIIYVQNDTISDREYTEDYMCKEFTYDFIKQARENNIQCFTEYGLFGNELDQYNDAIFTIGYTMFSIQGYGHSVVKTTVQGTELIIDPQTDIIMIAGNYTILYKGE